MKPTPSMRRCATLIGLTLCIALPLVASFDSRLDDIELYGDWARAIAQGLVPYRHFPMEYPPLATWVIVMPGLVSVSRAGFAAAFVISMAVWDALGKWGLSQSLAAERRPRFWAVVTALSLILNYIFLRRFDPVAACCTALALGGLTRRPGALWPFVWLGLGVAIKLYPIILAPGMLVFAWHQHKQWLRSTAQGLALALASSLPSLAAWLWLGPNSFSWLRFHHDRGLHVASSLMSWAIVWRGGPGVVLQPEFAYGCTQIVGAFSDRLAHLSPYLSLVALGVTFVAMAPGLKTPAGLWRMSTALICGLLLTAKVFSPQYMVWLVGIAAATSAQSRRVRLGFLVPLFMAAFATAQLFPGEARLFMGWRSAQGWLILRSVALAALWAYMLRPWAHWSSSLTTRRVIDNDAARRQIPLCTK